MSKGKRSEGVEPIECTEGIRVVADSVLSIDRENWARDVTSIACWIAFKKMVDEIKDFFLVQ